MVPALRRRAACVGLALACLAASAASAAEPATRPAGGRQAFDVRTFGATGDGSTNDTAALQRAFDAAAQAHGVAVVPPGVYRCGSLDLKSNLTVRIEAAATLKAIDQDVSLYPEIPATWFAPGTIVHSAVLQAVDAHDVAITGAGTIDGSGEWWWKTQVKAPVGRPTLVQFIRCQNVSIVGVHLADSPNWNVHPAYCDGVVVRDVTITAPPSSHNTDGIDPNSSRNVEIVGCTIDVGDDCIAIKSGADVPTDQRRPTENVVVRDCLMRHGHGGVTIGSETCGDVRNVRVSDCKFDGTDIGLRMKSRRGRGGTDEDIVVENVEMVGVKTPIHMTLFYMAKASTTERAVPHEADAGTPSMRGITLRNVSAVGAARAGFIEGLPERPIADVKLEHVRIAAAAGFELHDVDGLSFNDVTVRITGANGGPTTAPAKR